MDKLDYAEMNLEELKEAYVKELDNYIDQIPNKDKLNWLKSIKTADFMKVRIMRGYLMGLRDCGKNIGDLKLILEMISIELD